MPFARHYEYFEVRALLREAEGVASPVTGVGAHSRSLHAKATPGGQGATAAAMLHRTHKLPGESNSQFSNRGGVPKTSAFKNLVQQAAAATEALNSAKGQAALAVLDDQAHRAKRLRLSMDIPVTREMGFLPASGAPSLTVAHKDSPTLDKTQNTSAVRLIIDRGPGGTTLHIQTCIPLGGPAPAAAYSVKDMTTNSVVASG
jgi:hypothetical protein